MRSASQSAAVGSTRAPIGSACRSIVRQVCPWWPATTLAPSTCATTWPASFSDNRPPLCNSAGRMPKSASTAMGSMW
ncbi:hypothetical protein EFP18_11090 [Burkholderia glumae]|nr:hypothetical protein DF052_22115 [Burkholderia glumae]UVS84636.1 hypothetical protein EFP18_11090 [Burkholderia glumae]